MSTDRIALAPKVQDHIVYRSVQDLKEGYMLVLFMYLKALNDSFVLAQIENCGNFCKNYITD